ncbi:MAG: glycosyltransferase [Alphaproteobacteria bacterium]
MSKLKQPDIAFIVPNLAGFGGAERVMIDIASKIAEKGYSVDFVALKTPQNKDFDIHAHTNIMHKNINFVDFKSKRMRHSVFKLFNYMRKDKPKTIFSIINTANFLCCLYNVILGKPCKVFISEATTPSGAKKTYNSFAYKYIVPLFSKVLYPLADGIHAPSNGVKFDLENTFGIKNVTTIVNPIPSYSDEKSKLSTGHIWLENKETPVVISGGRLAKVKDFPTLIKAFSKVLKTLDAKLIIMGDGIERPNLETLIKDLQIENKIDLMGYTENPFAFMDKADVFVLSSLHEGMPNMLVQALGCGCPSVATNCPSGPSELIIDGKNGFLTPVGDTDKMAENIIKTINANFSKEQVKLTIAHHNINNIADQYLKLMGF